MSELSSDPLSECMQYEEEVRKAKEVARSADWQANYKDAGRILAQEVDNLEGLLGMARDAIEDRDRRIAELEELLRGWMRGYYCECDPIAGAVCRGCQQRDLTRAALSAEGGSGE